LGAVPDTFLLTPQDDDLRELRDTREWMDMLGTVKGGMTREQKVLLRAEAKVRRLCQGGVGRDVGGQRSTGSCGARQLLGCRDGRAREAGRFCSALQDKQQPVGQLQCRQLSRVPTAV
jgi:hypothetical protein